MRGIIVLHYWNSHTSLLESQAIKSAYKFLEVEDKHTPILSHMVQVDPLKDVMTKFKNHRSTKKNILEQENISVLLQWIQENSLGDVKILGLHLNACVAQLTTRLQEACELCGRSWENDFNVRIIKAATAGVNIEQPVAIADLTPDQRLSGLLE